MDDDTLEMSQAETTFARLLDEDEAFFHFISDEFNSVAGQATAEDLALYAFGSLEEALESYDLFRQENPQ